MLYILKNMHLNTIKEFVEFEIYLFVFRVIATCHFTAMRNMLAGAEMAAILARAWTRVQWFVEEEDRRRVRYAVGRYSDGNIDKDFGPVPTVHGAMEQWRSDLRHMDWAHSARVRTFTFEFGEGEPSIYCVDVMEGVEPPRARDGRPRYVSVEEFAEFMGWGGAGLHQV